MKEELQVGDRAYLGHRVQTLGLVAQSADGRCFGITVADPRSWISDASRDGGISSNRLLNRVVLEEGARDPQIKGYDIAGLCPLDQVLGESVHRVCPGFGRVQGVVSAVLGAALIDTKGARTLVRDLVEVRFDLGERSPGARSNTPGRKTPVLEPDDAGSIVCTPRGDVIGLLVAGSGHLGFVAPVAEYLAAHGLTHRRFDAANLPCEEIGRTALENLDDLAAQAAEIGREEEFGFDAMPRAA